MKKQKKDIPRIIHYCWFGKAPLSKNVEQCIESWRTFFPEYEIVQWNETNFDVNECAYTREAYEAKKWAFVSDFARFKVLYDNGGIYFDTDVEVISPMNDIIEKGSFMGCESDKPKHVSPGLGMAATAQNALIKELMEGYYRRHFKGVDGSIDCTSIVDYTTNILEKYGLVSGGGIQIINDMTIYPKEYFSPKSYETGKLSITENTRSIHHFEASWLSDNEKYAKKIEQKMAKFLPRLIAIKISLLISSIKYIGWVKTLTKIKDKIIRRNDNSFHTDI